MSKTACALGPSGRKRKFPSIPEQREKNDARTKVKVIRVLKACRFAFELCLRLCFLF